MLKKLEKKENKKETLRKKLIDYYNQINKDKTAIPAFMLADADMRIIEKNGTLDYWYNNFVNCD